MKWINNNSSRTHYWRRQFSLLLAVLWLLFFLQPCLLAAGGNVYTSFSENHQVHQHEQVGDNHHNSPLNDDQHQKADVQGNHQGCDNCPTGQGGSGDCCPDVSSCCSDQPPYINSLPDNVDSKDLNHKLSASGFPALFSLEDQAEPLTQFSRTPPEHFPPGPSVQSKYRVYLK